MTGWFTEHGVLKCDITPELKPDKRVIGKKKSICECGCGQETKIGRWSGVPNRFIKGHQNIGRKFSEETKKRMGKSRIGGKRSDETKRKMSEAQKGKEHTDEHKRNNSRSRIGKKHSDETKRKMSEAQKGKKGHNYGRKFSDKTRQKMSEINTGKKMSEETKRKISESLSGEKNHMWLGGISFEPYCAKFNNELKEIIRDNYYHKCALCGVPENGKKHSVHHIDYDKSQGCNGQNILMVPLCNSCHSKTNGKYVRDHYEHILTTIEKTRITMLDYDCNIHYKSLGL